VPVRWLIGELPGEDRPRERLLRLGPSALSDTELVAVVLRVGAAGVSVLELAADLLRESGGLAGLPGATAGALRRRGLGHGKASVLLAALEIGRRVARGEALPERQPLRAPAEVARFLALRYQRRDQEIMGALFLDGRHRLMGEREVFRGTIDRAAVEPRQILKECLLRDASGVVLFHTHPSGDPSPSAEDILFTRRMAAAGELVGVRLIDHLVLGNSGRWVSLRQQAPW
jgi:DNA repair protein RadC